MFDALTDKFNSVFKSLSGRGRITESNVADAMREYFDADFSFQNNGGVRANLAQGDVTAGDIFAVLPFGNELVEVRMEGRILRRIIERKLAGRSGGIIISGAEMEYDPTRPDYDRVVSLTIGGEAWDTDRIYTAIATNFLMEGNSGLDFLTAIPAEDITPTNILTSETLEWYIKKNSPVRPHVGRRWVEAIGKPQADYLKKEYLPES